MREIPACDVPDPVRAGYVSIVVAETNEEPAAKAKAEGERRGWVALRSYRC